MHCDCDHDCQREISGVHKEILGVKRLEALPDKVVIAGYL
jgi:chitinase